MSAAAPQQQQHHQQQRLCLVSWNISSGKLLEDYKAVNAMFHAMERSGTPVDIFAVQETLSLSKRWKEVGVFEGISTQYDGIHTDKESAVYYNKGKFEGVPFDHAVGMKIDVNDKNCFENRWINRTCIVSLTPLESKEEKPFVVISHHAPHKISDGAKQAHINSFFKKASELCEAHFPHSNVYIGGSFNFDIQEYTKTKPDVLHGFKLKEIGGAKMKTKALIDYILYRPATGAGAGRAAVVESVTRMEEPLNDRSSEHLPLIATVLLSPLLNSLQSVARGEAAAAHSTENERTPAATAATIAGVRPLTDKGGEEGEYSAAASGGESSSGTAAKVEKASAGATLPVV